MNTNKKLDDAGLQRLVNNIKNYSYSKGEVNGLVSPIEEAYIRSLFTGEGNPEDPTNPDPIPPVDLTNYYNKTECDERYVANSELQASSLITYNTVNGVKEFTSRQDGYIDNINITGRTLNNVGEIKQKDWNTTSQDCIRTRFYVGSNQSYFPIHDGVYTFYNYTDKQVVFPMLSTTSTTTWGEGIYVPANSCIVATIPNDYTCVGADFWVRDGWAQSDIDKIDTTKVMVLPGEHEFMSYFKGMQSIGEKGINILTRNGVFMSAPLEAGDINLSTGQLGANNTSNFRSVDFIDVSQHKTIVFTNFTHVIMYDNNKNFIKSINWHKPNVFLDVAECSYIKLWTSRTYENVKLLVNARLDEQQINTIIRSVPSGLSDTIFKMGGKYYKLKRCGIHTFDGSETDITPGVIGDYTRLRIIMPNDFKLNRDNMYCNILKVKNSTDFTSGEFVVGEVAPSIGKYVYLNLLRSRFPVFELANLKQWLADNRPTFIYELETPIIEELPDFNPRMFKGDNTIIFDSGAIKRESSFGITNSLRNEIEIIKDKTNSAFLFGSSTKKNLADKLTSIGIPNMSVSNTFAELIANIPSGGATTATGSAKPLSSSTTFRRYNDAANLNSYYISIQKTDINFDPNIIVCTSKNDVFYYVSIYVKDLLILKNCVLEIECRTDTNMGVDANMILINDLVNTANSYNIPISSSNTFEWIAFE